MNWNRDNQRNTSTLSIGGLQDAVNQLKCLYNDLNLKVGLVPAPVYGQFTIQDFRTTETFVKDSFILTDQGLEGLFVYDSDDLTSSDDGANILVKNNRRYKRVAGFNGDSAYQVALDNGFVGTNEEWLASLVGPQGIPGYVTQAYIDLAAQIEADRLVVVQGASQVVVNTALTEQSKNVAIEKASAASTSEINAMASEISANYSKVSAGISEANSALYAQRADLQLIPKGYYNPNTNTTINGALTNTPNPSFATGAYYEVDTPGVSQIAGANFAIGDNLIIGDRLEKIGTQWNLKRNPTTNYALNLDTQEKLKVIAHLKPEVVTASTQNGAAVDIVAQSITIPNTTSGNTSYLSFTFSRLNQYTWDLGDILYLEVIVTENTSNISNVGGQQVKFNLNVNRKVANVVTLIPDAAIETGFQRLSPTEVLLWLKYVIVDGDVEFLSYFQKTFPGATNNSGGFWRWTIQEVNYNIQKPTETLPPIAAKLHELGSSIVDNRLYSSLLYNPIETDLATGGLVFKNDNKIVIPNNATGINTYFWKLIPLTKLPDYKIGDKIEVIFIIKESFPGAITSVSPNRITANIWMRRTGDVINNVVESSKIERFDSTTVKVTLTTTITSADIELRPGLIVSSTVPNTTGSSLEFTLLSVDAFNLKEVSLVTANTDALNKIVQKVDINAKSIENSQLGLSSENNVIDGSATSGAVYASEVLTIPVGQHGNNSFIVLRFPISQYPVFADMIGKMVTFEYIAKTSTNLFDQRKLHLQTNVTTGGVVGGDQAINPDILFLDSTHIKLRFNYLVKFNDTSIDTYVQFFDTRLAVGVPQTLQLQNKIYFSWDDVNQKNINVNMFEKNSKIIKTEITGVANSNIVLPLTVLSGGTADGAGTAINVNQDTITINSGSNPGYTYLFKRNVTAEHLNWVPGKEIKFYLIIGENQPGMSENLFYKLRATVNSTIAGAYGERPSSSTYERLDANTVMYTITRTILADETSVDIILSTYGYVNVTGSSVVFTWKGLHYKMTSARSAFNPNSQVISDINDKVNSLEEGGKTTYIKIAKSGGDFTNVPAALAAILDASPSNKYVLVQYPGVYTEYEWKLKQYISLLGVDRDTCINQCYIPINANDNDIAQSSNFWTLGNNNVGNVTFRCRNGRYNLHDDQPGTEDSTNRFWNVNFIHEGNQSAVDWRNSPDNTLGYLAGNVWPNTIPIGKGNRSGSKTFWENCLFSATDKPCFGMHNQVDFQEGAYETFKNCIFKFNTDWSWSLLLQSYGAGKKCIFDGSGIVSTFGYCLALSDTTWFSTKSENQYSNHTEWEVTLPRYIAWVDPSWANGAYGLKITSNKVIGSSIVSVSGSAVADIFGSPVERHYGWGVNGYVYGSWDINPGINGGNNVLGKRLGNAAKTLVVTIDGVNFTINFSNSSALNNATIIGNINSVLGSAGVANTHAVGFLEYYPTVFGEFDGRNKSAVTIPKFTAIKRGVTANSILPMTSADNPNVLIGFTLDIIIPGSVGRCSTELVLGRYQLNGLAGPSTGNYGAGISLTPTVGFYTNGEACVVGRAVDIEFAFMQAPKNNYFPI